MNVKHYYIDEEKKNLVWKPIKLKQGQIKSDGINNRQLLEWWDNLKSFYVSVDILNVKK